MIAQETTRLLPLGNEETTDSSSHYRLVRQGQRHYSIFRHQKQFVVVVAAILGTVIAITCLIMPKNTALSKTTQTSSSAILLPDEQVLHWDEWKAQVSSSLPDAANDWWKGIGIHEEGSLQTVAKHLTDTFKQERPDDETTTSWWQNTEDWFQSAYQQTRQGAHHDMWMTMQNQRQWWNESVNSEQEWQNTTLINLHRFGHGLRDWWSRTRHASQQEVSRDISSWWNETEHATQHDEELLGKSVGGWWNKTEEVAQEDEHAVGRWWNRTEEAVQEDEHTTGKTIRGWWNRTEEAVREDEHTTGKTIRGWWNRTEEAVEEDEHAVGGWWNRTENAVEEDEERMQHNFQEWWKHANQKERAWWNHTVIAFGHFAHKANQKEHLWWNMTKQATKGAWNGTREEEQRFWLAAQSWFRAHANYVTQMNTPLLYLNTSRAYSILMDDYGWYDYSSDFFMYQSGWDAQINQAYCVVASVAAVLNSLRNVISLPVDPMYDPHPYATQHSVLDTHCVNKHVIHYNASFDGIFHVPGGLSLDQAQGLLECHLSPSFNVTVHYVDPNTTTVYKMRRDLWQALKDPTARVMVNYDRSILNQEGRGHFSPLGSYNKREDAFLIMDVAKYKYPPAWVTAARLFASMSTIDACGEWDYPSAQDLLRSELLQPNSTKLYRKALKKLHCMETFRGYTIVRPK